MRYSQKYNFNPKKSPKRLCRMDLSYVYFIQNIVTGSYKIGWARDVEERLISLQTGNEHELHIVSMIPVLDNRAPHWEAQIHKLVKRNRIRGEWFSLTEEELSWSYRELKKLMSQSTK